MKQAQKRTLNRSCGHIMSTGSTCGAYALRDSEFCYWHHKAVEARKQRTTSRKASGIVLPLLEDANHIQLAIQMVAQAVADRRISRSESGALLYSLQLAAMNLKNLKTPESICKRRTLAIPGQHSELGDASMARTIAVEDDPAFNYGLPDDEEDEDEIEEKPEEIAYAEAFINKNLKRLQRLGVASAALEPSPSTNTA